MSKYINADELKLEINREFLNYSQMIEKKKVMSIINTMPSADFVEVVRCKDCKHSLKHSEDVYECGCFCAMTTPKFYCADGERKETE